MKMTNYDYCCVCVDKGCDLAPVVETGPNNQTHCMNLCDVAPEINWLEIYKICLKCIKILNSIVDFKDSCIKAEKYRKDIEKAIKCTQECQKTVENQIDENTACDEPQLSNNTSSEDEDDVKPLSELIDIKPDKTPLRNARIPKKKQVEKPEKKRRKTVNIFNCNMCDSVFELVSKFIDHCRDSHNLDPKDIKPYVCKLCDKRFLRSCNLIKHMIYHEGNRSHMCSFCGKGFITKCDLKIHEMVHENKRSNKCDVCGKCFNTYKDVRSHKLIVHADKNTWKFVCPVCSKRFPIKSNFDTHMKRHIGVKNFHCHICNKSFIDKFVLKRHMVSHSNVREFKCAHCDKDYKYERVLKVHMKKAHNIGDVKLPTREKKFICHVCPKSYYAKDKLQRHIYTHTGEKPFFCTICEKRFIDRSYVRQHMKTAHNVLFSNDRV